MYKEPSPWLCSSWHFINSSWDWRSLVPLVLLCIINMEPKKLCSTCSDLWRVHLLLLANLVHNTFHYIIMIKKVWQSCLNNMNWLIDRLIVCLLISSWYRIKTFYISLITIIMYGIVCLYVCACMCVPVCTFQIYYIPPFHCMQRKVWFKICLRYYDLNDTYQGMLCHKVNDAAVLNIISAQRHHHKFILLLQ